MLLVARLLLRPAIAVLLITAFAGYLRFTHLGHPGELVFDEVYYPKAGCILIGGSDETCRIDSGDEKFWRNDKWDVGSWVHPPLGKWQIGLGIKAFGMDPFGWRAGTAVAGTLTVTAVAIIAQLLWRRVAWTYVAGGLMATEHLSVVMSRTAILDSHLALWVAVGFLCLVLDRRWIDGRTVAARAASAARSPAGDDAPGVVVASRAWRVPSPIWRPWRFAMGMAFGAAISVKWSGAMALFGAFVLTFAWETARRRSSSPTLARAFMRVFARESFPIVLALVVVPLVVYAAIALPWMHHFDWDLARWWDTQKGSFRYHFDGGLGWTGVDPDTGASTPTHPYYARWWEWIVPPGRPTSFHVQDLGPDTQQILALGAPAVFWANLFAMPLVVWSLVRRHDWRAGFIAVAFAAQLLPWIRVGRPTFFFYVTPLVPFMVLGVTYLLQVAADAKLVVRDRETGEVAINPETGAPAVSTAYVYRPFVVAYLIVAALLFLWFWPVMTAGQVSDVRWRLIVWFNRWI